MDLRRIAPKIIDAIKQYRFVLLIVVLGVGLMVLPNGERRDEKESETVTEPEKPDLALQLTEVLREMDGVGQVRVLLTTAAGEETVYQSDSDVTRQSEGNTAQHQNAVIISKADRSEAGMIRQIIPPKYLGAVVVCQGGDDPAVRLSVAEAVSVATGLGTDQITVLKMK